MLVRYDIANISFEIVDTNLYHPYDLSTLSEHNDIRKSRITLPCDNTISQKAFGLFDILMR
jgi:hypothetical protein